MHNIFEITSPDYDYKTYWYDKAFKPSNSDFRSKIRAKYVKMEKQNRLDELHPNLLLANQIRCDVKLVAQLAHLHEEEVVQICERMTEDSSPK